MNRISTLLQPLDAASCLPLYQLLTAQQAELLGAKERDAGLLVARLGFHKDGRAVEFAQSYYRADIYDFVAELNAST